MATKATNGQEGEGGGGRSILGGDSECSLRQQTGKKEKEWETLKAES